MKENVDCLIGLIFKRMSQILSWVDVLAVHHACSADMLCSWQTCQLPIHLHSWSQTCTMPRSCCHPVNRRHQHFTWS